MSIVNKGHDFYQDYPNHCLIIFNALAVRIIIVATIAEEAVISQSSHIMG